MVSDDWCSACMDVLTAGCLISSLSFLIGGGLVRTSPTLEGTFLIFLNRILNRPSIEFYKMNIVNIIVDMRLHLHNPFPSMYHLELEIPGLSLWQPPGIDLWLDIDNDQASELPPL